LARISFGQRRITATVADASYKASMEPVYNGRSLLRRGSCTVQAEERIILDRCFKILFTSSVTLSRLVNSYRCIEELLCLRNVANIHLGLFNSDDEGNRPTEMSVVYASQHGIKKNPEDMRFQQHRCKNLKHRIGRSVCIPLHFFFVAVNLPHA
jgi:hypothetical protein